MGVVTVIDGAGSFSEDFILRGGNAVLRVISMLPNKGCGNISILNDLFSTSFQPSERTIGRGTRNAKQRNSKTSCVALEQRGTGEVVLDARYVESVNARRVITMLSCVSDVLFFPVYYADLGRRDAFDGDVLRGCIQDLFKTFSREGLKTKIVILVLNCHNGVNERYVESLVQSRVQKLWQSIREDSKLPLKHVVDVQTWCLQHHRLQPEEYNQSVDGLRKNVQIALGNDQLSKGITAESFPEYSRFVWASMAQGDTEMPPRMVDLVALDGCDRACAALKASAWKQVDKWQATVDRSCLVDDYGFRATKLYDELLKRYDEKTFVYTDSRVQQSRREELASSFKEAISTQFVKQLKILQRKANSEVRSELLNEVKRFGLVSETRQDSLVREALGKFCAQAEKLEVAGLRLSAYAARVELESALHSLVIGLPGSSAAQALAVARNQRAENAPRKTYIPGNIYGGISVGVGLNSEIRNGGYGNAQAYSSYATGPHSFNMAYSNDADAALQEGRGAIPLIKMQPTLRFDIDPDYFLENLNADLSWVLERIRR